MKKIIYAALVASTSFAANSGVETKIFVPMIGESIYVHTSSIEITNKGKRAVLSRPMMVSNKKIKLELDSQQPVKLNSSTDNFLELNNLKNTSINTKYVSASNFTRIKFHSNGNLSYIYSDYYSNRPVYLNSSIGSFTCKQNGTTFFEDGSIKRCQSLLGESDVIINGEQMTIGTPKRQFLGGSIDFFSPTQLELVSIKKGRFQAACETGKGKYIDIAGHYKLNSSGSALELNSDRDQTVQSGNFVQSDTWQFEVRNCEIKGLMTHVFEGTDLLLGGLRLAYVGGTTNINRNAYKHICGLKGFEGGGYWRVTKLKEIYLNSSERFYAINEQGIIDKKLGDRVNVYTMLHCSGHVGEL